MGLMEVQTSSLKKNVAYFNQTLAHDILRIRGLTCVKRPHSKGDN